jgi:hypothetical protein
MIGQQAWDIIGEGDEKNEETIAGARKETGSRMDRDMHFV